MKDLLTYMLKAILPDAKFELIETEEGEGKITFIIKTDPENIGLLVGKGGHTIKALRNILKVRATLEKKAVFLNIQE